MIFNLLLRFYVFTLTYGDKEYLAMDEKTSPKILTLLAKENYYFVRYWVASNPNTLPESLTLLASDPDWQVRYRVVENPKTPQYVKDYLIARNFMRDYGY